MIEEKLSKLDDMSRSIDRIIHDVKNLKTIFHPRLILMNQLKIYVSMDESKKRTAMLRAKREFLERAFSTDWFHNNDEDLKMIGVSSIDSLFSNIKLNDKGMEEESTLATGRPHNSEGENLVEKFDKSRFREVKTLTSDVPTLSD